MDVSATEVESLVLLFFKNHFLGFLAFILFKLIGDVFLFIRISRRIFILYFVCIL